MGLARLLEALDRREEQEAIRDARRAMAMARAINGGATLEDVLADLLGPERAKAIVNAPARAEQKARLHADEG